MKYVVAILGLAVLMVVHEAGHYFAARAGGLRVTKFSIGFGPTLFKILPDGGYWTFFALGDRLKFRLFKHTAVEAAPGADTKVRVASARAAERAAVDRASSDRVSAERAAADATAEAERAALALAAAEGSDEEASEARAAKIAALRAASQKATVAMASAVERVATVRITGEKAVADRTAERVAAEKAEEAEAREPSSTIFQVAVIPFLAYVQIAGMNPLEENDPNDKGSYANAKLRTRIATIFAGPLANYLVASMFFFFPLYSSGVPTDPTTIRVAPDMPAAEAGLQDGDQIIEVDGEDVKSDWDKMSGRIINNADKPIEVVVLREAAGKKERLSFEVTPRLVGEDTKRAKIGVSMYGLRAAKNPDGTRVIGVGETALAAVALPPRIVGQALKQLGELVRGKSEAKLAGPKGMVDAMAEHYETGWVEFMLLLGQISTLLAVFNLLPIPALDGGRLLFLGYEATTRRRPNPTVEAHIHAIGLLMMLGLMIYVTIANDFGLAGGK